MANEAYRIKADTSIPRALRLLSEDEIQGKVYETVGVAYREGDVVLAEDISPPLRERAENGELDHLLEPVGREEAEAQLATQNIEFGVFIPEHEAEAIALMQAGHEVVPRDQALELASAGADAARSSFEATQEEGASERPGLTAAKVPSLAEVERREALAVVPEDSEHVDEAKLAGLERPPGFPTGADLAAAEGDESAQREVQERRTKRARPTRQKDAAESTAKREDTAAQAQGKQQAASGPSRGQAAKKQGE